MTYLWLKALHLAAVLIWVGGLVVLVVVSVGFRLGPEVTLPHERRLGTALLRWDRLVTVPAMLAVWVLGITLASVGGWFGAFWLSAKLGLVVALSGVHGVLSGRLRRQLHRAEGEAAGWMRAVTAVILFSLVAIAFLVVLKPNPAAAAHPSSSVSQGGQAFAG